MNSLLIAEKLKKMRAISNETQQEVADIIGIRQSTYAMYENGARIPSDENKRKLANHYNTTVQELFYA